MRVLARGSREVYRVYGEEEYLSRDAHGLREGTVEPESHEGAGEADTRERVRASGPVAQPPLLAGWPRGVTALAGVLIAVVAAVLVFAVLETRPRGRGAVVRSPRPTRAHAPLSAPLTPVRPIVGARRKPSRARRTTATLPSPSRTSERANRVGISHESGTPEARGGLPVPVVWPSAGEVVRALSGLEEFGFER